MINFERKRSLFIKIFISLSILGLIAFKINFDQVFDHLSHVKLSVWVGAVLCMVLQIVFLSYRWLAIINAHEKRIDYLNASQVTIASVLANYLFITSLGGLVVRVALSVQSGFSLVRSIAGTAIDRLMTLAALLILTIVFLPVSIGLSDHQIAKQSLVALCVFGGAAVLFSLIIFNTFKKQIIFSHRKVTACFKYLRVLFTDKPLLSKIVASSLLAQLSYFAAIYIVTMSYGLEFSWLNFIAILPFVTVISSLPIGYGGWGIREGAFVYGLGLITIPADIAFSVSIQIGLVSILASLVAAIPAIAIPSTFGNSFLRSQCSAQK